MIDQLTKMGYYDCNAVSDPEKLRGFMKHVRIIKAQERAVPLFTEEMFDIVPIEGIQEIPPGMIIFTRYGPIQF